MSEEEKKLVEKFKNLYIKDFNGEPITVDDRLSYIECALITKLIEKLDKELSNLKEIEQHHKADNGLLRQELDMQIEHNKELDNILYAKQSMIDELTQDEEKLKIELAKKKEKNKELEKIKFIIDDKLPPDIKYNVFCSRDYERLFKNNYISKDKIKGIQGRLFVQLGSYVRNEASPEQERIAGGINIINEILEEK